MFRPLIATFTISCPSEGKGAPSISFCPASKFWRLDHKPIKCFFCISSCNLILLTKQDTCICVNTVSNHAVFLVHCVAKVWYFDHKTISRLFWRAFVGQQTIRLIQWWLSRNSFSFVHQDYHDCQHFQKLQRIQFSFLISMIYFEHRPDERHQVEIFIETNWSPLVNYYPSSKSGDSHEFSSNRRSFYNVKNGHYTAHRAVVRSVSS